MDKYILIDSYDDKIEETPMCETHLIVYKEVYNVKEPAVYPTDDEVKCQFCKEGHS